MSRGVAIVLGAAAALVLPSASPTAPMSTTARAPLLTPCLEQGVKARCGTIRVPENRALPRGRVIDLNVVVLPARRPNGRREAFTYLAGGPGGAATQATAWVASRFALLNRTRDIVLVDQRGTGLSNPLFCPPPGSPIVSEAQLAAYVRRCLQSLRADVRQYGSRMAADDLDAVRRALGYTRLDVYGISYGATLAQVLLRRHPKAVRTVVLDGGTAIDVPFFGPFAQNAEAALDLVAQRCAADSGCAGTFPAWRDAFTTLVREWDAQPIQNRPGEATSGAGLAGVVQKMLISALDAAAIPHLVARAAAGDYAPLNARLRADAGGQSVMFWSIWCNEPWVGLGVSGPWGTDFDSLTNAALAQYHMTCRHIPKRVEPASAWRQGRSPTPVLALVGQADPQDPLTNLPALAQRFPDSRALVIAHQGHGVGQLGCLGDVVSRFVLRATTRGLDVRCAAAIQPPAFRLG